MGMPDAPSGLSSLQGIAAALPRFPGAAPPERESAGRKRLVRVVSVSAVLGTLAYLGWRVGFTVDLAFWWVAIPLLVLEFHNALGVAMFTVALWDVDDGPSVPLPRDEFDLRVAVLIPTYNEPEEVLLPTIAAAVALEPAHETWVLDDGRRPEVAALADELGARYLTRADNKHAKAGNLNNALKHVDADIVAVLDADHVAQPEFLRHTLGYFDDSNVALVQTPQDFYNLDSFEHSDRAGRQVFNEQAVFYRVIAAAKNHWKGAFWCGTCALVRVRALQSVGGVATGSVTEDILTTIRMHRRGWQTVYHNEVLARGLAARSLDEYLIQRHRWATGAMEVLRIENPLIVRGLSFGQRLSYATTLWAWFDSWRSLGYIVLPMLVLFTGGLPIDAPIEVFGPIFLAVLGFQFFALRLLARGHYPPFLSILFEFLRMPAVLSGTMALFRRRPRKFRVTPKGRAESKLRRTHVPRLVTVLLAGSALALLWFALTLAGLVPFTYEHPGTAIGVAVFLVANAGMLLASARRIRAPQFAAERRGGARLPVLLVGEIHGQSCEILDLSLTGTRVRLPGSIEDLPRSLMPTVALSGHDIALRARVNSRAGEAAGPAARGPRGGPRVRLRPAAGPRAPGPRAPCHRRRLRGCSDRGASRCATGLLRSRSLRTSARPTGHSRSGPGLRQPGVGATPVSPARPQAGHGPVQATRRHDQRDPARRGVKPPWW